MTVAVQEACLGRRPAVLSGLGAISAAATPGALPHHLWDRWWQ
jgi:hypothetical protein